MSGMQVVAATLLGGIQSGQKVAEGQAQKRAMNYNAEVAEQRASAIRQQASANEDDSRRRAAMVIGRQAAGAAEGSGLSGTNLDLLGQSATYAELDALNIRYGGKIGAASSLDQAKLDRMQGRDAARAGYINAAASAMSSYGGYANAGRRAPLG